MTRPFEVRVANWPDLVMKFVEAEDTAASFSRPAYLFRGQACAAWDDLRPSLTRVLQDAGITREEDASAVEGLLVRAFATRAHEYLPPAMLPGDINAQSWWITMQHYGAPTRVLDWTASPYVAAYFAVESRPACDGAIWLIHPRTIEAHFDPPTSEAAPVLGPFRVNVATAPPRIFFVWLARLTDRMAAQQTELVVASGILADQATFIGEAITEEEASKKFVKLVVPKDLKPEFLRHLRRLNITASALFPGIDGWGRSIRELAQLEARLRT